MIAARAAAVLAAFAAIACTTNHSAGASAPHKAAQRSFASGKRPAVLRLAGTERLDENTLQKCERDASHRLDVALKLELKDVDLADQANGAFGGNNARADGIRVVFCGVAADAIYQERRHLNWIGTQPTQIISSARSFLGNLIVTVSKGNPACRISAKYAYRPGSGEFSRIVVQPKVYIANFAQFQDSQPNGR